MNPEKGGFEPNEAKADISKFLDYIEMEKKQDLSELEGLSNEGLDKLFHEAMVLVADGKHRTEYFGRLRDKTHEILNQREDADKKVS